LPVWDKPREWKKKEPGARLRENQRRLQEKSVKERALMEQKSGTPVIWFIGDSWRTLFRLKKEDSVKSFQVILSKPMSMMEIEERISRAFGLNGGESP
jgi:hypothetical protein